MGVGLGIEVYWVVGPGSVVCVYILEPLVLLFTLRVRALPISTTLGCSDHRMRDATEMRHLRVPCGFDSVSPETNTTVITLPPVATGCGRTQRPIVPFHGNRTSAVRLATVGAQPHQATCTMSTAIFTPPRDAVATLSSHVTTLLNPSSYPL